MDTQSLDDKYSTTPIPFRAYLKQQAQQNLQDLPLPLQEPIDINNIKPLTQPPPARAPVIPPAVQSGINPSQIQDVITLLSGHLQPQGAQGTQGSTGNYSITPGSTPNSPDWQTFINSAKNVVAGRGLPDAVLPVLLGQAANESARGTSAPGNNYFGIKGGGNAGSNNLATKEYGASGYYGENSNFAGYQSPEDSINSYLSLILSYPGVPQAIQTGDPDTILRAIEANGYATSPTYVHDIESTPEFKGGF